MNFRNVIDKTLKEDFTKYWSPWGTPYELDFASDMILSIFFSNVYCHANNLRTTCCLYLVEQVYLVTLVWVLNFVLASLLSIFSFLCNNLHNFVSPFSFLLFPYYGQVRRYISLVLRSYIFIWILNGTLLPYYGRVP